MKRILILVEQAGMLPPKQKINPNWTTLDDYSKKEYYLTEWEGE